MLTFLGGISTACCESLPDCLCDRILLALGRWTVGAFPLPPPSGPKNLRILASAMLWFLPRHQ